MTSSPPAPSTIDWHNYKTDPPSPPNGYFLIIRKPVPGTAAEGQFPVEAQHWANCEGEPDGWYQSDGEDAIPDDDILYWAHLPEVFLPY
jgi:hypothetical protein